MGRTILVLIVIALVALLALWAIDLDFSPETEPAGVTTQRADVDVPEIEMDDERYASPGGLDQDRSALRNP